MVTVAFYKGKGSWLDKLIRLWTKSPYSHCEIIIYGVNYTSSFMDGGVVRRIMEVNPDSWDFIELNDVDKQFALDFFRKQIGKKYDYLGIFLSQLLPLSRHHKDKWFCSEICAAMLGLENAHEYSPEDLYQRIKEWV